MDKRRTFLSQISHRKPYNAAPKTLDELKHQGRLFSVVFRTFGEDLDDVVNAINTYAAGKYQPLFMGGPEFHVQKSYIWKGRYQPDGTFSLQCLENGRAVANENDVVNLLQGSSQAGSEKQINIVACQDDYFWWRDHDYHPSAGKPLWLTKDDKDNHHIFFDDNIHNDPSDGIVAVRVRENKTCQEFQPLNGDEILKLHEVHLVRVPTYEAILDENWFLKEIEKCEKAFRKHSHNSK